MIKFSSRIKKEYCKRRFLVIKTLMRVRIGLLFMSSTSIRCLLSLQTGSVHWCWKRECDDYFQKAKKHNVYLIKREREREKNKYCHNFANRLHAESSPSIRQFLVVRASYYSVLFSILFDISNCYYKLSTNYSNTNKSFVFLKLFTYNSRVSIN